MESLTGQITSQSTYHKNSHTRPIEIVPTLLQIETAKVSPLPNQLPYVSPRNNKNAGQTMCKYQQIKRMSTQSNPTEPRSSLQPNETHSVQFSGIKLLQETNTPPQYPQLRI